MTLKIIAHLLCDSCGTEHPTARGSAMEMRIAAGIDGWGYRAGRGTSRDERMRRTLDWCGGCSEESALAGRQKAIDGEAQDADQR